MTNQNQSIAVKQETAMTLKESMEDTGISVSDLVIPKLLLQQNTSEAVGDDKAKLGDIMNSQTLEILGGLETPLEVIPLKMFKTWAIMDLSGKQAEFVRSEVVTPANEKAPWEFNEEGKAMRRDLCMNFYVLTRVEVECDLAFPLLVQFKRTSTNAGKQLATQMFKMAALGRAPYSQTVKLAVRKEKYETNTYAKFEIQKGEAANPKCLAAAKDWVQKLKEMTVQVDLAPEKEVQAAQGPTVFASSSPTDQF